MRILALNLGDTHIPHSKDSLYRQCVLLTEDPVSWDALSLTNRPPEAVGEEHMEALGCWETSPCSLLSVTAAQVPG